MKPSIIPADLNGKEMFDFVVKNESLILHEKKSIMKQSDSVLYSVPVSQNRPKYAGKLFGLTSSISNDVNRLKIEAVINTTNLFDSHMDVHIPGLWNKSIADNKKNGFYLLERHQNDHRAVIGEGLKASAATKTWAELGFSGLGTTEALMFSGEIDKDSNPFMFDQYRKGKVKQHSVGMQYVKLLTCINDDDYPIQKENWDKYFPEVVNKDDVEEAGIFWAVLEAKIREGSAVLFGSNERTPTYSVSTKNEPVVATHDEPQRERNLVKQIYSLY